MGYLAQDDQGVVALARGGNATVEDGMNSATDRELRLWQAPPMAFEGTQYPARLQTAGLADYTIGFLIVVVQHLWADRYHRDRPPLRIVSR